MGTRRIPLIGVVAIQSPRGCFSCKRVMSQRRAQWRRRAKFRFCQRQESVVRLRLRRVFSGLQFRMYLRLLGLRILSRRITVALAMTRASFHKLLERKVTYQALEIE